MGPVVQEVQVGLGGQVSQGVLQSQSLVGLRYPFLPLAHYFPGNPGNRDLKEAATSDKTKTKNNPRPFVEPQ